MTSLSQLLDETASSPHYRPTQATAYNPLRISPPDSVRLPISHVELAQCQASANPLRHRQQLQASSGGVAGLPAKPQQSYGEGGGGGKRAYEQSEGGQEQYKRPRQNEDVRTVANHCEYLRLSLSLSRSSLTMRFARSQTTPGPTLIERSAWTAPSSGSRTSTTGPRAFSSPSSVEEKGVMIRKSRCSTSAVAKAGTCKSGPRRARTSTSVWVSHPSGFELLRRRLMGLLPSRSRCRLGRAGAIASQWHARGCCQIQG